MPRLGPDQVGEFEVAKGGGLWVANRGHTGVALFMVMSGFIFTVIAYGKDLDYAGFLRNRFIRIYPLYLFGVLMSVYMSRDTYVFTDVLGALLPFLNLARVGSRLFQPRGRSIRSPIAWARTARLSTCLPPFLSTSSMTRAMACPSLNGLSLLCCIACLMKNDDGNNRRCT
ncbi:hypothetical protein H0A65_17000 [Alcaligenaceae bacterium]|nr:hypothetical protein [Alcaligenaceae bacterium]